MTDRGVRAAGKLLSKNKELKKRISKLESLLIDAQGILIDSMLEEGYSDWMERADKALEPPR